MKKRTGPLELLMLTGCLAGFTGLEAALAQGGAVSLRQGQTAVTQDRNLQYGVQCLHSGRFRDAQYYLEIYTKRVPTDWQAQYYLALSREKLGKREEAGNLYKEIAINCLEKPLGLSAVTALKHIDPDWVTANVAMVKKIGNVTVPVKEKASPVRPTHSSSTAKTPPSQGLPRETRVHFEPGSRGIKLKAEINGRPVDMLFDTGAAGVCLSKEQLSDLGIRPPEGPHLGLTGGSANDTSIKYWRMKADVKVGNIMRKDTEITVLESNADMPLLGQSFFKDFDYTIDQNAGNIEFKLKAGPGPLNRAAYQVPFEFSERGNRILVMLEVNEQLVKVIFDTGNTASALSFSGQAQLKEAGITLPTDLKTTSMRGVSGSGYCKVFTIHKLRLGPIERQDVEATVNERESALEAPLLGQPFWSDWQYTIDMKRKLIEFVRRK